MNRDEREDFTLYTVVNGMQSRCPDLHSIVKLDEATWELEIIQPVNIDVTGLHKPFGFTVPYHSDITGQWIMGFSPARIVDLTMMFGDEKFADWLDWWIEHLSAHYKITEESEAMGLALDQFELEERVNA